MTSFPAADGPMNLWVAVLPRGLINVIWVVGIVEWLSDMPTEKTDPAGGVAGQRPSPWERASCFDRHQVLCRKQ